MNITRGNGSGNGPKSRLMSAGDHVVQALRRAIAYAAFTRNEQRIFLLLAFLLAAGAAIRVWRISAGAESAPTFDYTRSDEEFRRRSATLGLTADSVRHRTALPAKVNINTATKRELMALPGIGEAIAERIILYRQDHGAFTAPTQLTRVKGIGPRKFEQLQPYITLQ